MANKLVVKEAKTPSFIRKKNDLDKLLKMLSKESEAAVQVLINLMETSQDEKVRLACADKLLSYHIGVAESVNRDEMQRMIAEIKIGPNNGKRLVVDAEDSAPMLDFNTIREA